MFAWLSGWWTTWRVWRSMSAEEWAILTGPLEPGDFGVVERP